MGRVRTDALIPAAGKGERLGLGPKAFVEVAGITLVERAVTAFHGVVDEILVAVTAGCATRAAHVLGDRANVVEGGATRQETVRLLLEASDAELVLIHDAARPFLAADVISRVRAATLEDGAATASLDVADTLVARDSGEVVDRSALAAIQTPQGFRRSWILAAHHEAGRRGFTSTDDAGLARWMGRSVTLVEGSPWLMKVTTCRDLAVAKALAKVWDAA